MSQHIRIVIAAFITWLLAVAAIVLVLYWMVHFHHGFKWRSQDARTFNYHPLFMVIGFIFIAPSGAAIYRLSPQYISKFWQKIAHFGIQLTALAFAAMGLAAVIKFHKDFGYKNFIDVHSWCGLATIGLFTLQLVAGFISFLFPRLPDDLRSKVAKWHATSGKIIVLLAILTAINGVSRKYTGGSLTKEQQITNSLAMVLYVLFGVVFVMLNTPTDSRSNQNFQRFQ